MTELTTVQAVDHHTAKLNGTWLYRAAAAQEPGTLYGALSRLERRGWIRPLAAGERRRPYEITAAGQEVLAEQLRSMQQIVRVARQRTVTA